MDATMDLSSLLDAPAWDDRAVRQVRQAAFETSNRLDQFKSWLGKVSSQDDRLANLKAGVSMVLLGRYDAALEQLRQASESELKRFYMGLALKETGQYDAALTEFERAESKGWDAVDAGMQQVETLRRSGRLGDAEKLLSRHSRSAEASVEYHYQRGCMLVRTGQFDQAGAALDQALAIDPNHQGACFQKAWLLQIESEDDEAIQFYRRCVQTPPAPVNALINLAILYEDRGQYDLALRCLQEVLRVDSNHPRARLYMKDALAGLTQYYDEIQERARDKRTAVLEIPITDFELSVRSRNCLKKMNIHTLGDLLRVSETELLSYKNFGETSLNEIKVVLAQKGLRLGQAVEDERAETRKSAAGLAASAQDSEDVLSKSVDELELSVRSRRCLERLGLRTLGDLASRTEAELMAAKNFGVTSLTEVKQQLAQHSLSLRKLEE